MKVLKTDPPIRLQVTWMDACARSEYFEWHELEDRHFTLHEQHSIGFKLFETKDVLVLASSYDSEGVGDLHCIPINWITKIEKL